MNRFRLRKFGPIAQADLRLGDLTLFVGPQASGKSLALQAIKLLRDTDAVRRELVEFGFDDQNDAARLTERYFGRELADEIRHAKDTRASVDGRDFALDGVLKPPSRKRASTFLIPAQRTLVMPDGWPLPFLGAAGEPYVVRAFSEQLRRTLEDDDWSKGSESASGLPPYGRSVFPDPLRRHHATQAALQETIYSGARLSIDDSGTHRKRLVLSGRSGTLPQSAWSAGQREFTPLLLGLYGVMPARNDGRVAGVSLVIIEEPEMGLHAQAISAVLVLILDLIERGYRICLSTHSPQILEFAWALSAIQRGGVADDVLDLLGAERTFDHRHFAAAALKAKVRVYHFEPGGTVQDISKLDTAKASERESTWGGLIASAARASDVVARVALRRELNGSPDAQGRRSR